MTTQQLNRDIKRLRKTFIEIYGNERTEAKEKSFKAEFKRLYNVDREAKHLNAESLKTLIRINQVFRLIPFHSFFIQMEL